MIYCSQTKFKNKISKASSAYFFTNVFPRVDTFNVFKPSETVNKTGLFY